MRYIILRGGSIVDVVSDLKAARFTVLKYLPAGYKKGNILKDSEVVSIFKYTESYGA